MTVRPAAGRRASSGRERAAATRAAPKRRTAAGKPAHALYAYCLIRGADAPRTSPAQQGMPNASPPSAIAVGRDRWLVVSEVPASAYDAPAIEAGLRDLSWVSACALAHEKVIERFLDAPALLPMKLFTIFASANSARAALRRNARSTTALLRRLAGKVEYGVRVRLLAAPPSPAAAAAPRPSGVGAGAAFLQAKKHARDEHQIALAGAAAAAAAARQELAALAAQWSPLELPPAAAPSGLLLDAVFLVDRARTAELDAALARHGRVLRERGCELILTGPWPGYHFLNPPDA